MGDDLGFGELDQRTLTQRLEEICSIVEGPVSAEVAANGQIALAKWELQPYALIFADCTMPVMNGWEATHRLRTHPRLSHVPVVMLSCNTQQSDLQYAFACGAHSYLTKPIAPAHLVDHVRAVLRDRPKQAPLRAGLAECCVLVVDDGGPLRGRIGQALAELGCRILGATSGAEAFWLAREHVPDVILMDLALPQSRDAARHVRGLDDGGGPALHVGGLFHTSAGLREYPDRLELFFSPAQRAIYDARVAGLSTADFELSLGFGPERGAASATAHLRGKGTLGCERKSYTLEIAGPAQGCRALARAAG